MKNWFLSLATLALVLAPLAAFGADFNRRTVQRKLKQIDRKLQYQQRKITRLMELTTPNARQKAQRDKIKMDIVALVKVQAKLKDALKTKGRTVALDDGLVKSIEKVSGKMSTRRNRGKRNNRKGRSNQKKNMSWAAMNQLKAKVKLLDLQARKMEIKARRLRIQAELAKLKLEEAQIERKLGQANRQLVRYNRRSKRSDRKKRRGVKKAVVAKGKKGKKAAKAEKTVVQPKVTPVKKAPSMDEMDK